MEVNAELIRLSAELTKMIASSSISIIFDKISAIKSKKDNEEIINSLQEIINQLIAEKNTLIQIAQAFEQELVSQKISDEEITYITTEIVPLFKKLLENNENDEKLNEQIDILTSLLSKETFSILQLLGFNFKKAIGEPLTILVRDLILSKKPVNSELNYQLALLKEQREIEFFKIIQDKEAYQRLKEFTKID